MIVEAENFSYNLGENL